MSETPTGNPALVGLPAFMVGAVALGLVLTGFAPAGAAGASIPIIATATGIGLVFAAVWAARVGQSAVAAVFSIFSGFWISYAALVLGLTHNWFAIPADAVARTQEVYLVSWLVVIVMLTLGTLRLPLAFTALFALVDLAILLILIGTAQESTGLLKTAGFTVFGFVAVGAYIFLGSMASETGGKSLPLGSPVVS